MDRAEWLEARRLGIGGSDIAAVCGISRWSSPMTVYLDKIAASEPLEINEPIEWGNRLEAVVRQKFADEHPEFFVESPGLLIQGHPSHPWALATVDGFCYAAEKVALLLAGLEIKTASAYKRDEWSGDSPPVEYLAQCQWSMFVTGLPMWYLAVLIGGQTYREFTVERDEDFIATLVERGKAFWQLVESKTPPAVDGSDASKKVLDTLYPADEAVLDPPLFLQAQDEVEVMEYLKARSSLKEAEEQVRLHENRLKEKLGESAVGVTHGGYEVLWKPQAAQFIADADRLKTDGLFEKYKKPKKQSRRFSVKEPKEDS